MVTTKETIKEWLNRGKAEGASHVIIMCDTFDYEDYPVYVKPGENPRDRAVQGNMQRVMECYNLALDIDNQLGEDRAQHWEMHPKVTAKKFSGPESIPMLDVLQERNALTVRLAKAIAHLPVEQQVAIVSSFIPMEVLRVVVPFQEENR